MIQQEEQPIDIVPPEKIAFIAYNIGVYESVQKFGGLITSGKITNNESDVQKIAQLLWKPGLSMMLKWLPKLSMPYCEALVIINMLWAIIRSLLLIL